MAHAASDAAFDTPPRHCLDRFGSSCVGRWAVWGGEGCAKPKCARGARTEIGTVSGFIYCRAAHTSGAQDYGSSSRRAHLGDGLVSHLDDVETDHVCVAAQRVAELLEHPRRHVGPHERVLPDLVVLKVRLHPERERPLPGILSTAAREQKRMTATRRRGMQRNAQSLSFSFVLSQRC